MAGNPSFLAGYYDDYVTQVWAKYQSATLTIDTGTRGCCSPGLKLSVSRHDALIRLAIRMRDGPGYRSAGLETAGPASRAESLAARG
jgi:hypothetical protein